MDNQTNISPLALYKECERISSEVQGLTFSEMSNLGQHNEGAIVVVYYEEPQPPYDYRPVQFTGDWGNNTLLPDQRIDNAAQLAVKHPDHVPFLWHVQVFNLNSPNP